MSSSKSPSTVSKKSAFSCEGCRRRKVKCSGEQPACHRCVLRDEVCTYKLSPTLSYTQRLEKRVEELENALQEMRTEASPASSKLESVPEANVTAKESPSMQDLRTSEDLVQPDMRNSGGLKLDEKGSITYHGATSFFHLPSESTPAETSQLDPRMWNNFPILPSEGPQRRERLVHNAWQQRALESLSETPEPFKYLLNTHWAWIQPLFNFIYRPAFTRDMEVLGPYYSHMLMNAMLSHSTRWGTTDENTRRLLEPYEGGKLFGRQARTMLFEALSSGSCNITTVQTLLMLSAQECGRGNRTQAYLYSGIAFRLGEDMGIFFDGQRYAGSVKLSDEDIEIRHRLFWSCYFWDKMISLYLGRSPTIKHSNLSPPQMMLDDSSETDIWTPHGVVYPEGTEYPPMQSHATSCFMNMCRLSVIFNQILIHMYDPLQQNTAAEMQACLESEERELRSWRENLPSFLRLRWKSLPPHSPPSHIVTLNCLYHTYKILLYRPMLSRRPSSRQGQLKPDPNHIIYCVKSATAIIGIFDLFCRSFGHDRCVLALSYAVYTAASIFLLQVQAAIVQDEQTLRKLRYCIQALERVKTVNTVIGSALKLITSQLLRLGIDVSGTAAREQLLPSRDGLPNYQPQNTGPSNDPSTYGAREFHHERTENMPILHDFDPDGLETTPEMSEAFLLLEPLSETVTFPNTDAQ